MSGRPQILPEWIRYLCIEGVIGVGKTSLCRLLAPILNARAVLESAEENPFLPRFYQNRRSHAFQTQLWFLLSRYRQLSETIAQQDLFYCATISDYMFAKDRIFANVNLDEQEMPLYNTIASILEKRVAKPDFVLYLQASSNVLMTRIEKRKRPYEFNMDRSYIDTLNEAYNHFFFHYRDAPVLIIDTDEIDFVNNEDDLRLVVELLGAPRQGVYRYRPLSTKDRRAIAGMRAGTQRRDVRR